MKRTTIALVALTLTLSCAGAASAQNATDLDNAFAYLRTYEFGQNRASLAVIADAALASSKDPSLRASLVARMSEMLQQRCTVEAKRFLCRNLAVIGTGDAVPALIPLLQDENVADHALRALQEIPGAQADAALLDALKQGSSAQKVAVINALARRGAANSVSDLIALMGDGDTAVAQAAVTALGQLGGEQACAAILSARANAAPSLKPVLDNAALLCAEYYLKAGQVDKAVGLYQEFSAPDKPAHLRAASLSGLIHTQPNKAADLVVNALSGTDVEAAKTAAGLVRDIALLPGETTTRAVAALLPKAEPERQILIIEALADRGDTAAGNEVAKAIAMAEPAVQAAAVKALGFLGDASSVALLLEVAAGKEGPSRAARTALVSLPGDNVNQALVKVAKSGKAEMRLEALRALADRRATDVKTDLMKLIDLKDAEARGEVYKALQVVADQNDLPALLRQLKKPADEAHRQDIEKTLMAVCQRIPEEYERVTAVLAALDEAKAPELRLSLLRVAGGIPGPQSLAALRNALQDKDAAYRAEAVLRLGAWPDSAPLDDLWAVADGAGSTAEERSRALEGYLRLLRAASDRPPQDLLTRYTKALGKAQTPEEKKAAIAGVAGLASPGALALAQSCTTDAAIAAEANLAILSIAKAISGAYPDQAKAAVERFLAEGTEESQRNQAQAVIKALAGYEDYLVVWEVSGPYSENGKTAAMLFDISFVPEQQPEKAVWRIVPMALDEERPWVISLHKIMGGADRVAYLRTQLVSPKARDAILEVGSNDGVKVWFNGKLVDAVNSGRSLTPGEDRVPVSLKEGRNSLMMAVYQQAGDWGACARLRTPDGAPIKDVKTVIPD